MLEVWPVLQQALAPGGSLDLGLPAAVRGVLLGILFGLAVPASLLGIGALAECWTRRRRRIAAHQSTQVVRYLVPPDDGTPALDQFTAAERARLQRLRRTYREHQPTADRLG
jgi:hypothetical protein